MSRRVTIALVIRKCLPTAEEVRVLLSALSDELFQITGNDGKASFSEDDIQADRSVFLIALANGKYIGRSEAVCFEKVLQKGNH